MRISIVGVVLGLLVLGVSLAGCVSEELMREESAQEDSTRPDYLDNGIVDDTDLAKEFDAIPADATPKKVKRKISKVGK